MTPTHGVNSHDVRQCCWIVRRSRGENMYGIDQFMRSSLLQQEREAEEAAVAEAQAEHDQHEFDRRVNYATMLMKQFVKSEGRMVSKRALLKRFLESPSLGDCITERQAVFDAVFSIMLKVNDRVYVDDCADVVDIGSPRARRREQQTTKKRRRQPA